MIDWLHDLPTALGAGLVIAVFLLPTLIGSILFQPMVGWLVQRQKDPNTPVGFLLNAFTLYYGVLLALLSVAVFENYIQQSRGCNRARGLEPGRAVPERYRLSRTDPHGAGEHVARLCRGRDRPRRMAGAIA